MESTKSTKAGRTDEELSQSTIAASIIATNLGHTYETSDGQETVFSNVNLKIEANSFVSLIGKSGSGKSTLLNIVSGILDPTSGEIFFEFEGKERKGREDVTLGHVFQSPRLLPWESCTRNIEYVHANNPNYTDDLAKRYLDLVGLEDHYEKYPTQLSGGQKQRVGIARALSIDPDCLLMDEPFSNLDEITAENMRRELTSIWQQFEVTVLFVTHDITEAIELSDRIVMLGNGRIYDDLEVPLQRPREVDSTEFLKFRQQAIERFHNIEG